MWTLIVVIWGFCMLAYVGVRSYILFAVILTALIIFGTAFSIITETASPTEKPDRISEEIWDRASQSEKRMLKKIFD